MAKFSGKNGKMTVNGTQVHIRNWKFNGEVNLPNSTDSASAAAETHVIGNRSGSFTGTGYVEATDLPNTDIDAGVALTNVLLYLDSTLKITIASASISNLNFDVDIEGAGTVAFEFTAKVNGNWTGPA